MRSKAAFIMLALLLCAGALLSSCAHPVPELIPAGQVQENLAQLSAPGNTGAAVQDALASSGARPRHSGDQSLADLVPTRTQLARKTAAATNAPTATTAPTATPEPMPTPVPTETPVPTATPTVAATATPVPTVPPPAPDRIIAPSIGLDAPVIPLGWHEVTRADGTVYAEWDVAAYAAGWHRTSARLGEIGNTVITGHHNIEGEVFRYIVDLEPGDALTLRAGERAFDYVVIDKFILPEKHVSYEQRLENAQWIGHFPDERVTLLTCWPYDNNTHRVVVIASPAGGP